VGVGCGVKPSKAVRTSSRISFHRPATSKLRIAPSEGLTTGAVISVCIILGRRFHRGVGLTRPCRGLSAKVYPSVFLFVLSPLLSPSPFKKHTETKKGDNAVARYPLNPLKCDLVAL